MQTILLIEDDKTISLGITYFLKETGYQVVNIYEYIELEKINLANVDLILLDINLPDTDGITIFKEIKKNKNIPIIFLTANDKESNIVSCLDMGADDYITKPFKINILLSRIKMVLRRTTNDNIINIKNITIDLIRNRVLKNNKEIFLSPVEYKILVVLANNLGKIYNSRCLLQDIWDTNYEYIEENTLSVYIKRIREKIEDDKNNPQIIKTIRTKGYVIDEK